MMYGLLHASGVATFGYAVYYEFWQLHIPAGVPRTPALIAMSKFPGKWKYLTVWNLVLQFAYHTYSLANDVAGSNELSKKRQTIMQKIRDGFFASWIFPTGTFVSLVFWSLYAIDRELVFPSMLDSFYPTWLNHCVHTAPIIFLALDMVSVPKISINRNTAVLGNVTFSASYLGCNIKVYLICTLHGAVVRLFVCVTFWSIYAYDPKLMFPPVMEKIIPSWLNHVQHTAPLAFVMVNHFIVPKSYPRKRIGAPVLLLGTSTYLSWVVWVANQTGVYPYPILEVLNNVQRAAFLGSMAGVLLGLYFVGEKIQNWRWGDTKKESTSGSVSGKPKRKTK